MVAVDVVALTVDLPGGHRALDGVDLHVPDGGSLVFAGPSGAGKTTLWRTIAGLETAVDGDVRFDGQSVLTLPVRDRDIALVGAADGLYRHLDVEGNLNFPLQMHAMDQDQRRQRVRATSRVLRLTGLLGRRPRTLSTGERQRTAFGRATSRRPRLFLFDEPLVQVEPGERQRLTRELQQLQQGMGVTAIYVTHDQRELMTLGDRIAILAGGRVQQEGLPLDVYRRPANVAVAAFVGEPPMSFVRADLDLPRRQVRIAGRPIDLPPPALPALTGAPRTILAGLRAEDLRVGAPGAQLPLHVRQVSSLGFTLLVSGDLADRPASRVTATATPADRMAVGDVVPVGFSAEQLHLFDGASGVALYPREFR